MGQVVALPQSALTSTGATGWLAALKVLLF